MTALSPAGTIPTIGERIDSSYGELTPQEQRVADFILDNLGDLAVYNATELATLSGVSKATVSRLFRRLGFENSQQVRDHVRAIRNTGAPMSSGSLSGGSLAGGGSTGHLDREIANLRATLGQFDVAGPARLIATSGRVLVVGYRNSFPIAMHLREQLAQARPEVRLAPQPGQSLGEELADLGVGDVVVLVGFRRRPATFGPLVAAVSASGARSVLLADGSARRHASAVSHFLECPLDTGSAFDSYGTAMSVVSVLAGAVLAETGRSGRERVAAINALYSELDELERL